MRISDWSSDVCSSDLGRRNPREEDVEMIEFVLMLPIVLSAAFAGAALYINVAEQPARLGLDDRALLQQWGQSYRRGTLMQSNLALAAGPEGLIQYWFEPDPLRPVGAALIVAKWQFTFISE